jgi:hypothetical protein
VEQSVWNTIPDEWLAASGQELEAVLPQDVHIPMFVAPGGSVTRSDLSESSNRHHHTDDPILASFLLALVAATISGLGWYILSTMVSFRVDFVAVFVGLFIGLAMTMRVHHPGSFRMCASLIITVCTLVVIQYFLTRHTHVVQLRGVGLDPSNTPVLYLTGSAAYRAVLESIRNDPTKMLFWAIGGFASIKPSFSRPHNRAKK